MIFCTTNAKCRGGGWGSGSQRLLYMCCLILIQYTVLCIYYSAFVSCCCVTTLYVVLCTVMCFNICKLYKEKTKKLDLTWGMRTMTLENIIFGWLFSYQLAFEAYIVKLSFFFFYILTFFTTWHSDSFRFYWTECVSDLTCISNRGLAEILICSKLKFRMRNMKRFIWKVCI